MKNRSAGRKVFAAFTRKDLLGTLAGGTLLVLLIVGAGARMRHRSNVICCNCNLKQVGFAFKTWTLDHNDLFPMGVSTNSGGSKEYLTTGETFRHFQVMSNELSTPKILVCPQDARTPATGFDVGFGNSNISYFVGCVSNGSNPEALLSGDRNVTGGILPVNGLVVLTSNKVTAYVPDFHAGIANVGLADGGVQEPSSPVLRNLIGSATQSLAMP